MKLSFPNLKSSKGFTLIELLVVIAIIGILAAALIATIDPLEQIRKGQDTTIKTTAVEYLNALTRYYGSNQQFPWNTTSAPCSTLATGAAVQLSNNIFTAATTGCTALLITSGELKSSFTGVSTPTLSQLYVTVSGVVPNQSVVVCYSPTSKSASADVNTKYTQTGGTPPAGTCPSTTPGTCYWCAK